MFTAAAIVSSLVAAFLLLSAAGKYQRKPANFEQLAAVGVKHQQLTQLAHLEIAGAVGLVVGLFWAPIGIAAAAGVVVYFIGAITAHLRAGQRKHHRTAAVSHPRSCRARPADRHRLTSRRWTNSQLQPGFE